MASNERGPAWGVGAIAVLTCILVSTPSVQMAGAQSRKASPPPQIDCSRDDLATPEMAWCAEQAYKAADVELNTVYRAALAALDKADHMDAGEREKWRKARWQESQEDAAGSPPVDEPV